jgi:hypothetical protein
VGSLTRVVATANVIEANDNVRHARFDVRQAPYTIAADVAIPGAVRVAGSESSVNRSRPPAFRPLVVEFAPTLILTGGWLGRSSSGWVQFVVRRGVASLFLNVWRQAT